jgi:hypothetical protein
MPTAAMTTDRRMQLTATITAFALEMKELGIDFAMVTRDPELQAHGLRLCLATNADREYGEALLEAYLIAVDGGNAVLKEMTQVDLDGIQSASAD